MLPRWLSPLLDSLYGRCLEGCRFIFTLFRDVFLFIHLFCLGMFFGLFRDVFYFVEGCFLVCLGMFFTLFRDVFWLV